MTAQELIETLLERRNIFPKDGEYWSCVEVDTAEEIGRWPTVSEGCMKDVIGAL